MVVIIEHRKTFAPIILAIIAFVLWIPSLLCNVICASAMMEYVIVAVLIAAAAVAAAAVAAVAVFGRSIVAMFNVGGHAAVGDAKKAGDALTDENGGYRSQIRKNQEEASQFNEKFSNLGER